MTEQSFWTTVSQYLRMISTSLEASPFPFEFFMIFFFFGIVVNILMIYVVCRIVAKTGYSWALGLLMFVPIANIILPFVLAFSEWPIEKELKALKQYQPHESN